MSDDNGQEWTWMIGMVEGLGNVCFQRIRHSSPEHGFSRARRITTMSAKDAPGQKMEFDFKIHPCHLFGVWPEEMNIRSHAVHIFAEAPKKVAAVLEETWNPKAIKPATPAEVNRLKLGDKA